ncbi:MAG: hypothetical protein AAGD25_40030 [Cyanobacteria bacterium P01_F01_bin.150]
MNDAFNYLLGDTLEDSIFSSYNRTSTKPVRLNRGSGLNQFTDDSLLNRNVEQPHSLKSIDDLDAHRFQVNDTLVHPRQRSRSTRNQDSTKIKTRSIFNLNADLSKGGKFYRLPYPSDLRLDEESRPELSGLPISRLSLLASNLRRSAGDRTKFPVNTPGYFQFTAPVKPQSSDVVIPAKKKSSVWLVNVDPKSANWGKRYPTIAATLESDAYVPDHLLGVAPAPGVIMEANTTYAYVVKRSLRGEDGKLLKTASAFKTLQENKRPIKGSLGRDSKRLYRRLWRVLDDQGIKRKSIVTATVFSTGDVVADMEALSDQVLERYDITIDNLTLQPEITENARFHYLKGTVNLPQFQSGIPPFDLLGGQFEFDANNQLVPQRIEQNVPIVLTLPKTPMPERGYPLVAYYHGSNGLSTQVVDRGPITERGGTPALGLGPAHELAGAGFATLGMALPLAPERQGGNSNDGYLNPLNLSAYRDTFRQGVIEQRLLFEALSNLTIDSSLFSSSTVMTESSIETQESPAIAIQSDSFFVLGQSHGAQYAAMVGAVEPKVKVVIPTGSGGYWPLLVTESSESSIAGLALGTFNNLDVLHPALALLSTNWEAAEPIVYMPRLAQQPLPNHPARFVYQPVGLGDTQFPTSVFNAVALATGVQQAGTDIWLEMQSVLALNNLEGILAYPISNNQVSANGQSYTGVVVQYEGDGISDPHTIFTQLDAVKLQYVNFFKSFLETGVAVVSDPTGITVSRL